MQISRMDALSGLGKQLRLFLAQLLSLKHQKPLFKKAEKKLKTDTNLTRGVSPDNYIK